MSTPQSMFLDRKMKNIRIFYLKISIFWYVFVMVYLCIMVYIMTNENVKGYFWKKHRT